ncbi:MAG: N-acetyl sugar amidotransferase [Deltaproteobacteria bacterium]|nr:N-acetyl sugar amidotransferase [Deltaproteobacteria bacterium]
MIQQANAGGCKRCLYTVDHPLGLVLDDEGICSGCRVHEEKDRLDWAERWHKLESIVQQYRSRGASNYDCIVPVTGANDSFYILHLVKERLKLKPLLVTYNKYFNTPLGIRNLAKLRIRFNCDILVQNVNPVSVRKVTRTTLRELGSIYWPCLAGQTVFPVQTAVRFRVPLIIWGAHQGLEQVGMFSHEHEVQMTRRYRKEHDLMGREADDLLSQFDTLEEADVWQYRYPDDREINAVGVLGLYLGNYVRWDPKAQHEQMMREHGYQTAPFGRTFDCYDHVDCFNYMNVHDQLKLFKHGYSKVTDHATREIRHGRLTREQGSALVRRHEQVPPEYSELFCEWLGVTPHSLRFLLDRFRNPKFWDVDAPGKWTFHGWNTFDGSAVEVSEGRAVDANCRFYATSRVDERPEPAYIVVGKGYP